MRAALLLLVALAAPALAEEAPHRFALVVGSNTPLPGSGYAPLRYADDDALRVARLLRGLGAHVELLVDADAETAEGAAEELATARPPRRAEVLAALDRLAVALAAAPAPREVYIYFSGHGSVTGADAWLHLLDAPFHRTDLHARVLEALPRERLHVIIDSCHAYFLVNARGRVAARPDAERLDRYPDAGFLLSTSDRREVHEWSGYRGGVFTYQVLGALRGAADVDRDGRVSYLEAHAYIAAANLAVEDPSARIRPFVRAPRVGVPALLDLRREPRVEVPPEVMGHLRVRDGRGEPVLDAHTPGGGLALLVPGRDATLEVQGAVFDVAEAGGGLLFARADHGVPTVATRGRLDDDFRRNLFRQPLSPDFVAGFSARDVPEAAAAARPWTEDPLVWSLGAAGVAGLAVGGVATGLFLDARADAEARPVTAGTQAARDRAEGWRAGMIVGYGVGAALLTAAILDAALGRTEDVRGVSVGPAGVVGRF
ncbi:MAG: caspase family protein [Myxococcales bacterium]|nr:caspase family protein [Myxococcales bacterium]